MNKKAIALLELTSGTVVGDTNLLRTLSYFWTTTPFFNRFPVIDIQTGEGTNNLQKTLYLLEKYYNEGFRIFLGFSRSSIIDGILPWFNEHPDAIGVSPRSSSDSLNFPKNIYRMEPTDQTTINSINNILQNSINTGGKIYYVYSANEIASSTLLEYLKQTYGDNNIKSFAAEANSSNLTVQNMNEFYKNSTANDVVIIYLFVSNNRLTYLSLFNNIDGLDKPFKQYDIALDNLPILNNSTTTLKGKYIVFTVKSVTTSSLWDSGFEYMKNNYSPQALNSLFYITTLVASIPNKNIYSYNGVLQFNQNNDIEYYSYGLYEYTNEGLFFPGNINIYDPLYGNINFQVVT